MSTLAWAVAAVVSDDAGRVLLCRRDRGGRWALPGGRLRRPECPVGAVADEIHAETGVRVEVVDLVGIYHLTGSGCGRPGSGAGAGSPPDVLVHVFRARAPEPPAAVGPHGCRLRWHDPRDLPDEVTPVTRAAVADASAARSGVLRDLRPDRTTTGPATGPAPPRATGGETLPPPPRTAPALQPDTRPPR